MNLCEKLILMLKKRGFVYGADHKFLMFLFFYFFIEKEILCLNLTSPANGVVQYSNEVGGEASYECGNSYQLLGNRRRTCRADGAWSGDEPSCFIPCPTLPSPVGGTVSQNGTRPGSVACYTCDAGLVLVGCSTSAGDCAQCRTCDASGDWDGLEPVCTSKM